MSKPHIIMFANNKGGCGKSTVAFQVAMAIAEMKRKAKVLVVDCDLQANITATLAGTVKATHRIKRAKFPSKQNSRVHCLFSGGDASAAEPSETAGYDYVIIDTAPAPLPPEGCIPDVLMVPYNGAFAAEGVNRMKSWVTVHKVRMVLIEVQTSRFSKTNQSRMAKSLGGIKPSASIPRSDAIANNPHIPAHKLRSRGAARLVSAYNDVARIAMGAS